MTIQFNVLRRTALLFGFALIATAQNGINITDAKVYDNRSLTLMLEQLNQQLLTTPSVDLQKIATALANQQGSQTSEITTALSVTSPVVPGMKTTEKPATDGTLSISERTTDRAAVTPGGPTVPESLTPPTYAPSFGQNAQDVLGEQVNLSYRILNLRMLLERSLTDRIWNKMPRLQTVFGMQVSLDPPKNTRDQAAIVEITLVPKKNGAAASLIAMMPEAKTYNTSALSNKNLAFGGSAVTQMFTVGFNQRRRGQIFYLYQDNDTLALGQVPNPEGAPKDAVTFGWEFRPVLGRRSVSAGLRQLFAVLALEAEDTGDARYFEVQTKTYWRRYDKDTMTTQSGDKNSALERALPNQLAVYSSDTYETALKPTIADTDGITWQATDDANALVTIKGKNFYSGTKVFLGNVIHDAAATGLTIKSDRTMELRAPLREIALGRGYISGRYGPPILLELTQKPAAGILLNYVTYPKTTRDNLTVEIFLQNADGGPLDSLSDTPLIYMGDSLLPSAYSTETLKCKERGPAKTPASTCVKLSINAPTKLMTKDALLTVRVPFRGESWVTSVPVYDPSSVTGVTLLGGPAEATKVGITGRGFDSGWVIELDKTYTTSDKSLTQSDTLMTFTLKAEDLAKYKQVVVRPPSGLPIVLALPAATPPKLSPSVDAGQTFPVTKNSGKPVTIKGKDLMGIKTVKFNDAVLAAQPKKDGSELTVVLTRDVTKEMGEVTIRLEAEDGTFFPVVITVTGP